MARNEEKQLARLNRFYLQKEKEETLKKNPPRPRLENLKSAAEVQKWIPSIKRDIDFCVKQSMVPCYPKSTIQEFNARIDRLKGEYKAFIRRLRELEPEMTATPWSERPYAGHKRTAADPQDSAMMKDDTESKKTKKTFCRLAAPILEQDVRYKGVYGYVEQPRVIYNVDPQTQDEPLHFRACSEDSDIQDNKPCDIGVYGGSVDSDNKPCDIGVYGGSVDSDNKPCDIGLKGRSVDNDNKACNISIQGGPVDSSDMQSEDLSGNMQENDHCVQSSCVSTNKRKVLCVTQSQPSVANQTLNLPYSDSDSDGSHSS